MQNVKCVMIGDTGVGKTCLLLRYGANCFRSDYVPTVYDNFAVHIMVDEQAVYLGVWDTVGCDDHDAIRPLHYPNTNVYLICFSVSNRKSFEQVSNKWLPEVKRYGTNAPVVLAGLKRDLRTEAIAKSNVVMFEEGVEKAKEIEAASYCEASTLADEGVTQLFHEVARVGIQRKRDKCILM
mmetsp:Transcript_2515/g.3328  ORF Transcript_2515/g.3328 Transcript_2515/m.3328 type:complete len:181 (+) Transcript_2515:51-593(+)